MLKRPLAWVAGRLESVGVRADHLTWLGFAIGLSAMLWLAMGWFKWALLCIAVNRLFDGLDGALARLTQPTDRGAFLDIALDFLFYASVPLGFALADPAHNALPAAVLLFSFVGTGSSFLAFAVLAGKRGLSSTAFQGKGFYYLGGLTESTETVAVFVLMCWWPDGFGLLAYGFSALCALTIVTRLAAGVRAFGGDASGG